VVTAWRRVWLCLSLGQAEDDLPGILVDRDVELGARVGSQHLHVALTHHHSFVGVKYSGGEAGARAASTALGHGDAVGVEQGGLEGVPEQFGFTFTAGGGVAECGAEFGTGSAGLVQLFELGEQLGAGKHEIGKVWDGRSCLLR
jgi:hypothetical protein